MIHSHFVLYFVLIVASKAIYRKKRTNRTNSEQFWHQIDQTEEQTVSIKRRLLKSHNSNFILSCISLYICTYICVCVYKYIVTYMGVYRAHIILFFQSKNGCSHWEMLQVTRYVVITNNYPQEIIAVGYYVNTLFISANTLGTYAIPLSMSIWDNMARATHSTLLGHSGCSLTQKETFYTTELVSPLPQYQKTQVAK